MPVFAFFLTALAAVAALRPSAAFAAGPAVDTSAALIQSSTPLYTWLVVVPLVLPLISAGALLALRNNVRLQATATLIVMALTTAGAIGLNAVVALGGPVMMAAGNWLPPFGIVITIDQLGALLVLVTSLVGLIGVGYARFDIDEDGVQFGFFSFYLLLIAGVNGSFSTGDIFNLYVWFEVFLIASFGLLIMGGRRIQLDGAVKYGVLNLIATTIFLIAVAALYGVTGTLNMADIRTVLAEADVDPPLAIGALFVLAFLMKAAAFPLHFWLPAAYHTPRIVVAALFAGLLTKVGVYALLRIVVMLYGTAGAGFLPLIGVLGVLTSILGALAALAQTDLRRMAAFLVVSGIGVMLIGIGLGTEAGYAGAIVYAVHSIFVMTALFLAIGLCETADRRAQPFAARRRLRPQRARRRALPRLRLRRGRPAAVLRLLAQADADPGLARNRGDDGDRRGGRRHPQRFPHHHRDRPGLGADVPKARGRAGAAGERCDGPRPAASLCSRPS